MALSGDISRILREVGTSTARINQMCSDREKTLGVSENLPRIITSSLKLAEELQNCKASMRQRVKKLQQGCQIKKNKKKRDLPPSPSSHGNTPPLPPSMGSNLVTKGSEESMMTVFSFQSNTPCLSASKASYWRPDLPLRPFVSVAVPSKLLAADQLRGQRTSSFPSNGLRFGDILYIQHLDGKDMPNGDRHNGYVVVSDVCGDDHNQEYCFDKASQKVKLDLYVGDWTALPTSGCSNPSGTGLDATAVRRVGAEHVDKIKDYGGRAIGGGSCGDCQRAKTEMASCWYYTPPSSSSEWCPDLISQGVANK